MIDWDKPVQTRDGREVRIWTRDAKCDPDYPVQGEIYNHRSGEWTYTTWVSTGAYYKIDNEGRDLINVPEKRTLWVNVNPDKRKDAGFQHKISADTCAGPDRIKCIEVEYEV